MGEHEMPPQPTNSSHLNTTGYQFRVVYRVKHRKKHHVAPASPAAAAPAVAFGCEILQTGPGQLEFNVTTTGGATSDGTVYVSFYDYPGSGDTFPPTTVQGATPVGAWNPVPAADIGASAEHVMGGRVTARPRLPLCGTPGHECDEDAEPGGTRTPRPHFATMCDSVMAVGRRLNRKLSCGDTLLSGHAAGCAPDAGSGQGGGNTRPSLLLRSNDQTTKPIRWERS